MSTENPKRSTGLQFWRAEIDRRRPRWLEESPGVTVFEGDIIEIYHDNGVSYDVQNGGTLSDPEHGPETWLTEGVLARFSGKRVRVTVEEIERQ